MRIGRAVHGLGGLVLVVSGALLQPHAGIAQPLALGPELRVNTMTTNSQYFHAVAPAPGGGFVVVWQSSQQDGSDNGIFGQRFGANAAPLGSEFQVNTITTSHQSFPTVASSSDGSFLAAWTNTGPIPTLARGIQPLTGVPPTIRGQIYGSSGAPVGAEFTVGQSSYFGSVVDASAASAPGGYLVVWNDVSGNDIYGQVMDQAGNFLRPRLLVNSVTSGNQVLPAASGAVDGIYTVVWQSNWGDGSGTSISGALLNTAGDVITPEFTVNSITTGNQQAPAVARASDGFVVAWEGPDGHYQGIWARRFDGSGPVGAEFRVNTVTSGAQSRPSVAIDANHDFVVSWDSPGEDGSGTAVVMQRFKADGTPVGGPQRVNAFTGGNQYAPKLASTGNGTFVAAWQSVGQDGSYHGVYARGKCLTGDVDGNGSINVNDVLYLINTLFANGPAPAGCADASGNGLVDVGDVLYLINYLFSNGPAPV